MKIRTANERPRTGDAQAIQRQRIVATERRRHERTRMLAVVGVLTVTLGGLSGAAAYHGWLPASLRSHVLPGPDTAGERFAATRIGTVRSYVRDGVCRDLQFSNDPSGAMVGGREVPCEAGLPHDPSRPQPSTRSERLNSIRDAFAPR
jgi:hypothetical protein